ncbi:MAG: hypothetical protein ACM3O5_07765 [Betaproteobacteria bacterium]
MALKTVNRGNRWRLAGWGAAAVLPLVPLVAMQFTDEVNWSLADVVVFGALLACAGAAFELAVRMSQSTAYRAAAGVGLAAAFLLVWVNGAVGIIGSEDNPANLMYAGVLAIGLAGAAIARLRPRGMARTLVAMAVAQALVAVIAFPAEPGYVPFAATIFFGALWLAAAWLFRRAALEPARADAVP